jgi:transcriptional regulator with XRE-family HTH domain
MQVCERSIAEFRAIRETVGMTQGMLADALGVEQRSVRRWESKSAPQEPPQDAWDVLDSALRTQRLGIAAALGKMDELAQKYGDYPAVVNLPYWPSQEDYDRDHCVDDGGDWRMANATNRVLAYAFYERGVRVEWTSGPTVPRMD